MIKFEHTLFAMPFAIISACFSAGGVPTFDKILWILIAMISARSSAMAFNRIADAKIDAQNPRTKNFAIPAGLISIKSATIFTTFCSLIFVFSAYMLNATCLVLSPLALFIILSYSYTKRFTYLTHFYLGLSLAIAPIGAWIAIQESFALFPIVLGGGVILWVAGFDIIYACQDVDFDKKIGLYSIPAILGIKKGLFISFLLHLASIAIFAILIPLANMGKFFIAGLIISSILIIHEHAIVKPHDLKKVNQAFFTLNASVSICLMVFGLLDLFLKS
jgi:4-hydroxybenzoate polyprenyltransferase